MTSNNFSSRSSTKWKNQRLDQHRRRLINNSMVNLPSNSLLDKDNNQWASLLCRQIIIPKFLKVRTRITSSVNFFLPICKATWLASSSGPSSTRMRYRAKGSRWICRHLFNLGKRRNQKFSITGNLLHKLLTNSLLVCWIMGKVWGSLVILTTQLTFKISTRVLTNKTQTCVCLSPAIVSSTLLKSKIITHMLYKIPKDKVKYPLAWILNPWCSHSHHGNNTNTTTQILGQSKKLQEAVGISFLWAHRIQTCLFNLLATLKNKVKCPLAWTLKPWCSHNHLHSTMSRSSLTICGSILIYLP